MKFLLIAFFVKHTLQVVHNISVKRELKRLQRAFSPNRLIPSTNNGTDNASRHFSISLEYKRKGQVTKLLQTKRLRCFKDKHRAIYSTKVSSTLPVLSIISLLDKERNKNTQCARFSRNLYLDVEGSIHE